MNFGKVVFDPGHKVGANIDPVYPNYSEGTAMYNLGLMLNQRIGVSLTKINGLDNPSLEERCETAKRLGANIFISLHTNYPTLGTIVYYSVRRPSDKVIAEQLGQHIANALGVKFRGAYTKLYPNRTDIDYYGIIRGAVNRGIEHPLLVEHCAHSELAVGTQEKLNKLVEVYKSFLGIGGDEIMLDGIIIMLGDGDISGGLQAHNLTGFPMTFETAYNAKPIPAKLRIHVGGLDRPNTPTDIYCGGPNRNATMADLLREFHVI